MAPQGGNRKFKDDQGVSHELVPSSVIASVPSARQMAIEAGERVRFHFLDDRQVHWLLHQRWEDVSQRSAVGCVSGILLAALGVGGWYFWDAYASEESGAFKAATVAVYVVISAVFLLIAASVGKNTTFVRQRRNIRIRTRLYREIAITARRGGADIPRRYPYYGLQPTARKFFPDEPEMEMPEDWESTLDE